MTRYELIAHIRSTMECEAFIYEYIDWDFGNVISIETTNKAFTQQDVQQYPLLRSEMGNYNNHWSNFKSNLNSFKLASDDILEMDRFWDTVDLAFMTTLGCNKGLKSYKELNQYYDPKVHLLPADKSNSKYNECLNVYINLSTVLRNVLIDP